MVMSTIDLIYIVGFIIVIGTLFISSGGLLIFCFAAVIHIAIGTASLCGALPLPTLTNNNYLVLTHGSLDIYWFAMSIIIYIFILLRSTWWELE